MVLICIEEGESSALRGDRGSHHASITVHITFSCRGVPSAAAADGPVHSCSVCQAMGFVTNYQVRV